MNKKYYSLFGSIFALLLMISIPMIPNMPAQNLDNQKTINLDPPKYEKVILTGKVFYENGPIVFYPTVALYDDHPDDSIGRLSFTILGSFFFLGVESERYYWIYASAPFNLQDRINGEIGAHNNLDENGDKPEYYVHGDRLIEDLGIITIKYNP